MASLMDPIFDKKKSSTKKEKEELTSGILGMLAGDLTAQNPDMLPSSGFVRVDGPEAPQVDDYSIASLLSKGVEPMYQQPEQTPQLASAQQVGAPLVNLATQGAVTPEKSRQEQIYDQLLGLQSKALEQQRGGIGRFENMIGQYQDKLAGQQRPDLTNLLKGMSFFAGTDLTSGYQAPEDQTKTLLGLEQMLQEQKSDLSDKELGFLKTKLGFELKKDEKTKGKELSQTMVKNINEGNQIPTMLADVENTITNNADIFGPVEGRLRGVNPWDTRAKTIDAQNRAVSQAFGKYMEGGVLRKEDETKYRKMFPQLADTPEVASNKLQIIKRLLQQKQQSDLQAFKAQGFDTRGLDRGFEMPSSPNVGGVTTPRKIEYKSEAAKNLAKEFGL